MKNIDQYYVFSYNQSYRLQHMNYYREYCRNYNINHRQEINAYNKKYYNKKKYIQKHSKEPLIEVIEGPVRLLFS